MGNEISGIAKSVLQIRAGLQTGTSKEEENDIAVNFMEMMNQSGLSNKNISAGMNKLELRTDVKGMTNTAYDTYAAPTKSVSVKKDITPEEMSAQAAEPLEEYEAKIREVLKEELGVTDEEISDAMESLGMSFLDMRSLQNLTSLVQELTGEDIGTLFLSEAFVNVAEQVSDLTETLCAELGITRDELNLYCEAWEQMEVMKDADTVLLEESEMPKAGENKPLQQEDGMVEVQMVSEALPKEEAEIIVQKEDAAAVKEAGETLEEAQTAEQTVVDQTEAGTEKKGFMDHSKEKGTDVANDGSSFVNQGQQTVVRTEEFVLPQEAAQPYSTQVDTFDLIEQIAKNVRVTISATTTSMEMQLNPENLGKLYLNVSEKEGVVRAQIATQNQVVKEALETQLVELRQSLNQQGIKVDAIEVTVGTHEFEQNLEENAKHEEQMQQQMNESKKQTRRSINLNDLDGLAGLMSEEEQLAAQIMRDNGNQVDLTA